MNSYEEVWYERSLRDAVMAGDEAAWRTLYGRHFASLYAYVHSRARGVLARQAEDAVQECWLVAVRRICDFDPTRGSFESWLKGIAANVLREQSRRSLRRREIRDDGDAPAAGIENLTTSEPARDLGLAEQIALVMSELPLRYQEVLRAKYDDKLPVAEIAVRRGTTSKAIESLLSRARALFRENFDRINKER